MLTSAYRAQVGGQSLQQIAKAIKEGVVASSRGVQRPNVEMNGASLWWRGWHY
jgi:hypothetical protein